MRRCSRVVMGFLNVIALAFSIFQIIDSLITDAHPKNKKQCYNHSTGVILMISIFLLMASLIGLMSSCGKSNRALGMIYLSVVLISTIVAITSTVFISVELPKASANSTWQKSQDGNWIKEFSPLLRQALVNDKKWFLIKTCLVDIDLCHGFRNHSSHSHSPWREDFHYLEVNFYHSSL